MLVVCLCLRVFSHQSCTLYSMTDDHNDTSSVVLEDSCCGTLQQLAIRAERGVEGNVDTARNMSSAVAGGSGVKALNRYAKGLEG